MLFSRYRLYLGLGAALALAIAIVWLARSSQPRAAPATPFSIIGKQVAPVEPQVMQPSPASPDAGKAAVAPCPAGTGAVREFTLVNDRGTVADEKGGPPLHRVSHHLTLRITVSPQASLVTISTSAGPLSPPEALLRVEVRPDARGEAVVELDLPGRPDRVFADAQPRHDPDLADPCAGRVSWGERMIRILVEP